MKPTNKSPMVDAFISSFMGKDRKETIESSKCMTCSGPATYFKDELSRREYTISGMCQDCQANIWG